MSVDIRIAHTDDERPRPNVIIAPRTVTSFCRFLTEEEQRRGRLPFALTHLGDRIAILQSVTAIG